MLLILVSFGEKIKFRFSRQGYVLGCYKLKKEYNHHMQTWLLWLQPINSTIERWRYLLRYNIKMTSSFEFED